MRSRLSLLFLQLLHSLFNSDEIKAITSIPLSPLGGNRKFIWGHCKSGKFSVKSAYRLARMGDQWLNPPIGDYWKQLWSLKIPPKIAHFLWCCSKNFLPCNDPLFRRFVAPDPTCPRCFQAPESTLHVCWSCPETKTVLERLPFFGCLNSAQFATFMDLFRFAFNNLSKEECCFLAFGIWASWKERNLVVIAGQKACSWTFIQCCQDWEAWRDTHARVKRPAVPANVEVSRWRAPPLGSLVINADAARSLDGTEVGVGAVIRNHEGQLRVAMGEKLLGPISVCAAELLALILGMEWARDRSWMVERVESDCLQAIQLVNNYEECFSEDGVLVNYARELLKDLGLQRLTHIPRCCNKAAHVVAAYASRRQGRRYWMSVEPPWLTDIIEFDCNSSRTVDRNSIVDPSTSISLPVNSALS